MAKKRFRIKDAQGNVVPYDVAAEDVTLSDGRSVETGKASVLNNAGFLDPAHFPKLMLYNVTPFTSEPDYSAIPVGSIYLDEREDAPYKRLFYKKNIDGNTQTIDLGAPQDGVVYCHQSTGILYRWVPTSYGRDGSFQQVGGDADLRDDSNHVKQSLATPVVLRNVSAATLDDLAVGDVYFDEGHLFCHVSSSNDADLGAPSKKLIYFCLADSKCYRWTGSSFTAITVAPHIDPTTGNWFIGTTNTGIHAQGPKGNSVADGDTFEIVNNLTDGGEGDALSAEMGKWLYTNLYTIFTQLGNYAFPNGKPQIDWGGGNPPVIPPCTVSKTIGAGLSSTGGDSDVAFGDPLEVSIAITDNLYIVDDDSVAVTMGGSPVRGAWDASTMKVTIAAVTGNVVINVPSLTYVGYGEQNSPLAFMLDCKNRGNQSGHWIDLIGNIDFTLGSSVVAADTGVVFDGTLNSYGETDSSLVIPSASGTIDAVVLGASATYNPILINPADYRIGLCICTPSGSTKRAIMNLGYTGIQEPTQNSCVETGNVNDFAMSMNKERYVNKGTSIATNIRFSFIMNAAHTKLTIGRARRPDHNNDLAFVGTIKAIRVYNSVLTADQQLQNWKVDQKRFNIS